MRHVFIINPNAGKIDVTNEIFNKLKKYNGKITYDVYVTSKRNDAYLFTKQFLETYDGDIRFYACGGDGTLNEVVNGAAGSSRATVACYPSGSGNDFIKVFGTIEDFTDFDDLINGTTKTIDLISVNDRYTINIANFGFDANVAYNMAKFKNRPFSGRGAYNLAVIYSLISKMKHRVNVTIDEKEVFSGNMLLSAVANGICYGGGYYCSPNALVDDGLANVTIVKSLPRTKFIKMIGKYKKGTYLEDDKIMKYVTYTTAKKIVFESSKSLIYCMDGEVESSKNIVIKVVPRALKFVVPRKLS
jgi:YegS/Rv2252/BmrU family lipid kinase